VVFDTIVEDLPECIAADRPWSKGNNPKTAVQAFLRSNRRFAVDEELEAKLLISVAPNGFLKCIED
jgi:cephalosporin hydroxylase